MQTRGCGANSGCGNAVKVVVELVERRLQRRGVADAWADLHQRTRGGLDVVAMRRNVAEAGVGDGVRRAGKGGNGYRDQKQCPCHWASFEGLWSQELAQSRGSATGVRRRGIGESNPPSSIEVAAWLLLPLPAPARRDPPTLVRSASMSGAATRALGSRPRMLGRPSAATTVPPTAAVRVT